MPPVVNLLQMRDVTRVHGVGETAVVAVRGVSFGVAPGQLLMVTGASGSGKSTLLSLAGGLDQPTSGRVWVAGEDLAKIPRPALANLRRTFIGYVFQDLNWVDALTAVDNVALPLELDGAAPRAARRSASAALERVGLAGLDRRFPEQLSGGQQQRVAIARAFVGRRRLVLADEPTGALDTGAGRHVVELLRGLCDEGAAVVLATHDENHRRYADRVVRLYDGRLVEGAGA